MTESDETTPDGTSTASYQTRDEAEESFLALVRALRAIRTANDRPARVTPVPPAA
jgi:hypothetical protein